MKIFFVSNGGLGEDHEIIGIVAAPDESHREIITKIIDGQKKQYRADYATHTSMAEKNKQHRVAPPDFNYRPPSPHPVRPDLTTMVKGALTKCGYEWVDGDDDFELNEMELEADP